jgi:hypothetical protein
VAVTFTGHSTTTGNQTREGKLTVELNANVQFHNPHKRKRRHSMTSETFLTHSKDAALLAIKLQHHHRKLSDGNTGRNVLPAVITRTADSITRGEK